MSGAVSFATIWTSKPIRGDVLLGLVFALPVIALVLTFAVSPRGERGPIAQSAIEIASSQM